MSLGIAIYSLAVAIACGPPPEGVEYAPASFGSAGNPETIASSRLIPLPGLQINDATLELVAESQSKEWRAWTCNETLYLQGGDVLYVVVIGGVVPDTPVIENVELYEFEDDTGEVEDATGAPKIRLFFKVWDDHSQMCLMFLFDVNRARCVYAIPMIRVIKAID